LVGCQYLLPRFARLDRYAGHNGYKIHATSRIAVQFVTTVRVGAAAPRVSPAFANRDRLQSAVTSYLIHEPVIHPVGQPCLSQKGHGRAVESVARVPVLAHENVLLRMSAPAGKQAPAPQAAWPTASYFDDFTKLPTHCRGIVRI
jgi:hypothetical protein